MKKRTVSIVAVVVMIALAAAAVLLYRAGKPLPGETAVEEPCTQRELDARAVLGDAITSRLPLWVSLWQRLDPEFSVGAFACLDVEQLNESVREPYEGEGPVDEGLLVPSPDGSRLVDLHSYHWEIRKDGGRVRVSALGPDSEVVLVDRKDRALVRLLFLGTDAGVDDAVWLDNDTIVVVGYQDAHDDAGNALPGREPLVWIFRLQERSVAIYGGLPAEGYDPRDYLVRKFTQAPEAR